MVKDLVTDIGLLIAAIAAQRGGTIAVKAGAGITFILAIDAAVDLGAVMRHLGQIREASNAAMRFGCRCPGSG